MSDLFGNHVVVFSTRWLIYLIFQHAKNETDLQSLINKMEVEVSLLRHFRPIFPISFYLTPYGEYRCVHLLIYPCDIHK